MRPRPASLLRLSILSVLLGWQSNTALALPNDPVELASRNAAVCCAELSKLLPGVVSSPTSNQFQSQQKEYFTLQQQALTPTCRVTPKSAKDVSKIVKLAVSKGCEFAVRSGGHGHTTGESNIGRSGFTIDLTGLNTISLSNSTGVASVASGSIWTDVYVYLVARGRVATGGNMPTVGAGGFLLGGGVSLFSDQTGFGCTQVVNYEVVLSDGSIVNANQKERPDLYWALKMGNTNFGIVTRYEIETIPVGQMWGGGISYSTLDHFPNILEWLVGFAARSSDDNKGHSAFGVSSGGGIWHLNAYSKPVEYPSPLFDGLVFPNATENSMKVQDLVSVTKDVYAHNPIDLRTRYLTFTFKPDVQFGLDVHKKAKSVLDPFLTRKGMQWSVSYQPISKAMITSSMRNGGNPSGLTPADGDLILALYTLFWEDAADDAELTSASDRLYAWTVQTAKARKVHHPFIYLNYADGTQPVYAGFGKANVKKLKSIQKKYDQGLKYSKVWKGGFEL